MGAATTSGKSNNNNNNNGPESGNNMFIHSYPANDALSFMLSRCTERSV